MNVAQVDEYKPKNKFIKYIIFGLTFYVPDIGDQIENVGFQDFGCSDQTKNDKVEQDGAIHLDVILNIILFMIYILTMVMKKVFFKRC